MEKENTKNLKPQNTQSFLPFPALRICGQVASWTGNSVPEQRDVGIRVFLVFDTLTGKIAMSQLEMQNEGSTAIFYSWQRCTVTRSFNHLTTLQSKKPLFYFSSSPGVVLPGGNKLVEFSFKSKKPGIHTEVWQLNTQPVLLQGASILVVLRGIAVMPDINADRRHLLQTLLEKKVSVKMCESIVCEMVRNVRTPERPGSPAEFVITEEQRFTDKNNKLHYLYQPVEDLKTLWQKVNPEQMWDFSVDTLHQVLLSQTESSRDTRGPVMEENLARFNFLLLKLSEPNTIKHQHLAAADLGRQLWIGLLDRMSEEAIWLKHLLNVPERETLNDPLQLFDTGEDEKIPRSESKSSFKDENRGDSKSPIRERLVQASNKKSKKGKEVVKPSKEKQTTMTDSKITNQQFYNDKGLEIKIYRNLLYERVYALMEDLVYSLCDWLTDQDTKEHHRWEPMGTGVSRNQPSVMC